MKKDEVEWNEVDRSTVKLVDEGDMVLRWESKKKMEISLRRKTKNDRKKSESEMKKQRGDRSDERK